jgi:leader peptidase (prepilin peptidase)/N-methyltransferase
MTDATIGGEPVEYSTEVSGRAQLAAHATAAIVLLVGFGLSWALPVFLLMAMCLVAAALIDLRLLRLPNELLAVPFLVGAVALPVLTVTTDQGSIGGAALAAVLGFVGMLALHLLYPAGLGLGDVKLGAVMGLYLGWLGWDAVGFAFLAGFVSAGLVSALIMWRTDGQAAVPFGPFLVASTVVSAAVYAV